MLIKTDQILHTLFSEPEGVVIIAAARGFTVDRNVGGGRLNPPTGVAIFKGAEL